MYSSLHKCLFWDHHLTQMAIIYWLIILWIIDEFENHQPPIPGRPARFQTSNFIGRYNLHSLLLSGLGLLFRSLPIVLLDQS